MNHIESMLNAHPDRARMQSTAGFAAAIAACLDCVQTCNSCADACVAEDKGRMLLRCIRLDLDCAAICAATATLLGHGYEGDSKVLRAQLQACLAACAACAQECERHAKMHEHCRICAEVCRICERACQQVVDRLPALAMA